MSGLAYRIAKTSTEMRTAFNNGRMQRDTTVWPGGRAGGWAGRGEGRPRGRARERGRGRGWGVL